jgi:hypothetical protein
MFLAALLLASLPAPQVQSPKAQPHFAQQAYLAPHKGGNGIWRELDTRFTATGQ